MNPAERTCALIDAVLCGYPGHIREARVILGLGNTSVTSFADESGTDGKSQHIVINALVAPPNDWKMFSLEWFALLIASNPKPLKNDSKGKIRYKASYADNQRECFAGFSPEEADQKTDRLIALLTEYLVSGYSLSCSLSHEVFHRVTEKLIIKSKKGERHSTFKNPYHMCFWFLILGIIKIQLEKAVPYQKVDFFFDEYCKTGDQCLRMYRNVKKSLGALADNIMGQAFPADDAEVMPVQASDMMASRFKDALDDRCGKISEAFRTLVESRNCIHLPITEPLLADHIADINLRYSVDVLERIKLKRKLEGR
jgi:hypothetical protein